MTVKSSLAKKDAKFLFRYCLVFLVEGQRATICVKTKSSPELVSTHGLTYLSSWQHSASPLNVLDLKESVPCVQ